MSGAGTGKLGSIGVEPVPGAPEPGPPEPDPSSGSTGAPGFEPGSGDVSDDDGPFFAWLPPEDRLWRHPSEGASRSPILSSSRRPLALIGSGGNTWAVALIAGVIGALAASGLAVTTGWLSHTTTVIRTVQSESPTLSVADGGSSVNWTAVDDAVSPTVVGITVQGGSGPQTGSGVLMASIGGTGYVVTDRSLMAASLSMGYLGAVEVTFLSGQQSKGKLIGQDPLSGLAVIEVSDPNRTVPASPGSVATLSDADTVLALGAKASPAGSVSLASISGEDQKIQLADGSDMDNLLIFSPSMAATAAGGPLVDAYGHVIGVTVGLQPMNSTDSQASFAVPIDEVTRVVDEIVTGQRVTHPWLGVDGAINVPTATAQLFGLEGGAEVQTILSGSPASSIGMRAGDIISSFNRQPVTSSGTLVSLLEQTNPGQTVPIAFIDGARLVTSKVTVSSEPNDAG